MNSPRATVVICLLCLLGGCREYNISQPIALVPSTSFSALEKTALSHAAQCWNYRFGTKFSVPDKASHLQQVVVDYEDAICPLARAGTTAYFPAAVYICPPKYFNAERRIIEDTFFAIVLHELGHVLNIRDHAERGRELSVMAPSSRGPSPLIPHRFSAADVQLLQAANPDFLIDSPCREVLIPSDFGGKDNPDYHGCSCLR